MYEIYRQIPLYRFLMYCNQNPLPNQVLDCGAGGNMPPLGLFWEHGYDTVGIEYSENQILLAQQFEKMYEMELHIKKGDMRELPFTDESFSYVYSYNAVFHMKKDEVEESIKEMKRVLKPQGLLFVNFLSTSDFRCGTGEDFLNHQYLQLEDDEKIMHSYYEKEEAEQYFHEMKLLYKEDRTLERIYEGNMIRQGFIDYILRK